MKIDETSFVASPQALYALITPNNLNNLNKYDLNKSNNTMIVMPLVTLVTNNLKNPNIP